MKMKEFGTPGEACIPGAPLVSANELFHAFFHCFSTVDLQTGSGNHP